MTHVINNVLIGLNNIGRVFCDYAAGVFVQSALLVILLLVVDLLLRKRVRAVFRYFVWLLVLVKLVLPPTLSLPTGIGYWVGDRLPAAASISDRAIDVAGLEHTGPYASQGSGLSGEMPQVRPAEDITENDALITPANSAPTPLTWQAVLFVIWLVGVFAFLVVLIQRVRFVRGLIAVSSPAKEELLGLLEQCRRKIGVRWDIRLQISDAIPSPAVCGFFRPTVLIPTSLVEKLSPEGLRATLIHELAHIKRGDLWVNSVQTFLQIIYFYNPFVWFANAVIRRVCEEAVDETVLVTLGGQARNYSNTLIDIGEMAFWRADLGLRLIGVAESKNALQWRIKHMLNRPIPKKAKLGILGLMVIVIIAVILLPMAQGSWGQKASIGKLVEKLNSKDDAVWKPAVEQLQKIGPKVARQVAELFQTAPGDLHAIRVLESMATDEHVQDVMVQGLSADPHLTNSNVRHCSLIILSKSGNRGHVKRIIPLLRKDVENGKNYSMAAIALSELGGDEAYNALVETVTKDIPDQMRWMIADGLVRVGRAEAVPYLKDALKLVDPSHPSAGARIVEAIHRLEDKNEIVEKPYPNGLYSFTLREFDSGYSQRGILYAYDLQRAGNASAYVDKPPAGANAEEIMSGNLRALSAGSKGDLIFERLGEQTRLQAYHGTLLAPLEVKTEPPHHYWTDAVEKMHQSKLKQLVLDYNNKRAKGIVGSIPGFRLYPFNEGDSFAAVLPNGQIAILATKKIESYTSGVRLNVLYLDPLLALVGTGRIEASQESTADVDKSQFIATMPHGVTVELVGICEHPSQGKQWWRPDGTGFIKPPYDKFKAKVYPDSNEQAKEIAVRIWGPQELVKQTSVEWKIADSTSSAGNVDDRDERGDQIMHTRAVAFKCDIEQQSLAFKVGIAAGPWQAVSTCPVDAWMHHEDDSGIGQVIWHGPSEKDSMAFIVAAIAKQTDDIRLIAVDEQGNIHHRGRSSGYYRDNRQNLQAKFDLPLAQVKEFQLQTRPYQWIIFKNVSLKPGIKTDVQVEVEVDRVVLLSNHKELALAARVYADDHDGNYAENKQQSNKSLHQAARDGDIEQVKKLIAQGADVNTKDEEGLTVLHLAARQGRKNAVELLLANGANINARLIGWPGWMPLHEAAAANHKEVAELLITKGADANADCARAGGGRFGGTPLHEAVFEGHRDMAELLISKGADINAKQSGGLTPLDIAAFVGHKGVVELLIAKGADVHIMDRGRRTALRWAKHGRNKEIVELLQKHGAVEW